MSADVSQIHVNLFQLCLRPMTLDCNWLLYIHPSKDCILILLTTGFLCSDLGVNCMKLKFWIDKRVEGQWSWQFHQHPCPCCLSNGGPIWAHWARCEKKKCCNLEKMLICFAVIIIRICFAVVIILILPHTLRWFHAGGWCPIH
jgi:hypothetical protein